MAKNSKTTTRVFYLLLTLTGIIIFLPARLTDRLNFSLSGITNTFTGPPQQFANEFRGEFDNLLSDNSPESQLKAQYLAVLSELNNARSEIEYQKRFIQELANIRSDLSLARAILVRSHITAVDSSVSRKCRIIDRGSNDYIRPGLIALASVSSSYTEGASTNDIVWKSAVAGRVIEVRPNSSVIQMINDPAFTATVTIKPALNRGLDFATEGVVYTDRSGNIHVRHVETSSEVLPGDTVFLKASEHTLPVDVIIGYVAECSYDPDNAVLWNITVAPALDLSDVSDVVVVCHNTIE